MMRLRTLALLVLVIAPAGLAQDFVDWLPEKTLAYVSVGDMARLRERLDKSAFAAIWNDPAMKPLRTLIEKEMAEQQDGKASPADFLDLLQGHVCFALVPVSTAKEAPVLLLDLKGKQREILDLIGRLDEQEEGDLRKEEEDFHGYTLMTYRRLIEGAEEPEVDYRVHKDDLYAISDDIDLLKDIVTRREAADKTGLSASEAHKQVLAATAARADLRWYVSSATWLREFGAMAAPVLAALGMEKVKAIGGQFSVTDRGIQSQIVIQNDGEARGFLKLFGGNIENLGPPPILPPDVDPSFTIAIDWQQVYTEAMRLLATFQPDAVAGAEGMIGQLEQQLGMKLYDDVLGAMAPGLTYAFLPIPEAELAKAPKGVQFAEFAAQFMVFFQKLRNTEKMQALLTKLTAQEGSPFKEVVYLGTKMYESELPGLPAFAIIDGQLALGFRPDSVRALIQRQGKELKSFRDTEAYKRGLSLVPARRSVFMVTNPEVSVGASLFWVGFWEGMRTAGADGRIAEAAPPMEFIEKYQDVSVLAVSTEEQGLVVNWFWGLKAPEGGKR